MTSATKQRALRAAGAVAKHLPSDRAQLFAFVASPAVRAEPWQLYQRLHRTGPIRPGPFGSWIIASHEGVSTVLRSKHSSVDETKLPGGDTFDRSGAFTQLMDRTLLFTDPPEHHQLRRLVTRAFTPTRVASLEPAIRTVAHQLLDDLRERGSGDLIEDFALPFPVAVISELLGLPQADQRQFLIWARDLAPRLDVEFSRDADKEARGNHAAENLTRYLDDVIGHPSRRRPDGLIAALADSTSDDRLDRDDIVALCALLLVAGFETTTNLIANSVHQLLSNSAQLTALRSGHAPIDTAVEELLRTAGPVQFSQRILLEDLDVSGHTIPAGTLAALLIGAANRDPLVFEDPDRLDLTRGPNPHLAFSFGIHHCLGAALARLEVTTALPAIFERLPALQLIGRSKWRDTFVLRGMTALPVRWKT